MKAIAKYPGAPQLFRAVFRLRGVQIENRPALELIKRFNYKNVLIYCGPPYMLSTRHGKQYRMEMEDKDHEPLLDALLKHKGYVVISGYDTPLYNAVLKGWKKRQKKAYTQTSSPKQEIIWMNFEPQIKQLSLADYQKEGKFELPGSVVKV